MNYSQHVTYQILRLYSSYNWTFLSLYQALPISPRNQPLATTLLISVYMRLDLFFFLDSSHKWYHEVFVFFCLAYFISYNALKFYLCCCKWKDFLLPHDSIFTYIWILCTHTPHIYHIFSHSLLTGYVTPWLLWIMLHPTWECRYLFSIPFLFPLDIYTS